MSGGMRKRSKMSRCLAKARELYIFIVTEWAVQLGGSGGGGGSEAMARASVSCDAEVDVRELMRIASTRSHMLGTARVDDPPEKERRRRPTAAAGRRSCSVEIGRIDEEEECEFGDDGKVVAYPRSRSDNGGGPKLREEI